uniref:non-specific serine/threonine protein kinase n=1 Tax=Pyramimonas obovata TaxID=1411642 RepID=A0A7S0RDU7_9CHLO|mmetsp:Transcript_31943/g.69751  ORF Transcript_31943/g.69751 Transcript_31943/m.69751 type:complete len:524 (+) Transcript_31943:213-1784(+)|eukprot:CAMPEP_0118946920 /NCGR_PEP_ID=MMETSP1169-20130426/45095_1 /TAXON_ID=36882 /ORGANISM="Pyramimonas obovata, Strain CCMP722" /LENGTH=523 /DNA_ID=CAMNT_0006893021 /DNA_START=152 /DNA_END=1723 /DNA_ORIENTATION=-
MGNCFSSGDKKPQNQPPSSTPFKTQQRQNGTPSEKPPPLPPDSVRKPKLTHVGSILKRDVETLDDHYIRGKELGRGQFGITYLCTHMETREQYACKSISKKRKICTKEDAEDVRREIAIMHHLSGHENIVSMKESYEDKENVHLVMEVCTGGELFDHIIEMGHLSERRAAKTFRSIMTVVAQSHALGVMHRDLKPENFLLKDKSSDAAVKATDWGLSVFFAPGQKYKDIVGSAYYVAPEVLKKNYGPEIDVWSAGVILYILLSGVPPFWAETEGGIFEAVRRGVYDLNAKPWDKISNTAKDLIRKLLVHDPKKRLTAAEALQHRWLRAPGDQSDTVLDDTVLTRLKKLSGMNKLKKMALNVIAKNMHSHEIEGLRALFVTFDEDKSGAITVEEMRTGLKTMGSQLSEKELEEIMANADIDGDGQISYEEFIASTMHMSKLNTEENLWHAFQTFDTDDSGFITPDELRDALERHHMNVDSMDEILRDVDQDGDGRIDYNEFVALMRYGLGGGQGLDLANINVQI